MSELPVISVEGLAKRYVIGHEVRHDTFRDRLVHGVGGLFRRRAAAQASQEEFWALRDVSFEVNRGEVVGVIGRNGAGKSTLLKILSRITEPTKGRVSLRGRVASLLEVGTGFHPELTGRENIFLNGAILGMSRVEIRRKFDEIVAFSEVERFLDTPVKRYSSGMYVRLAFAVAAHLEPEILIVDEVLAVGDAQFQKKCLGKMRSITREDRRTILFVSHNLDAVRQLCDRVVVLSRGEVEHVGPTDVGLDHYMESETLGTEYRRAPDATPSGVMFEAIRVCDASGKLASQFDCGVPPRIHLDVRVVEPGLPPFQVNLRLTTREGTPLFTTTNSDSDRRLASLPPGLHRFVVPLPADLAPGDFSLNLAICEPRRKIHDSVVDKVGFQVTSRGSLGEALADDRRGLVELVLPWEHRIAP